tara:strand:+ start:844 stop:1209 length:366 start_codon:yes stop_codon:yes gene_type:complete
MFDIGSTELLLIVIVAVVVIGPKDLPRALYKVGQMLGKARSMSRHFRSGIDAMIREAEMEDLQKKWDADNRRIMAQHPQVEAVQEPEYDASTVIGSASLPAPEAEAADAPTPAPTGSEKPA